MCNRRVKFGLKISNHLGKMSENIGQGGGGLTHTVVCRIWLCTVQGTQMCKLNHECGGRVVVNSLSFHPTMPTLISACQNKLYLWKLTTT